MPISIRRYIAGRQVWSNGAHLPINSSLPPTVASTIIDCLERERQSVAVSTQKLAAEKYLAIWPATPESGRMMYACSVISRPSRPASRRELLIMLIKLASCKSAPAALARHSRSYYPCHLHFLLPSTIHSTRVTLWCWAPVTAERRIHMMISYLLEHLYSTH